MTLEESIKERLKELIAYYQENGDKLRAPLFRRFCDRTRWETQWRELWSVIKEYEKHDGELGNRLIKYEGFDYKILPWSPLLQAHEKSALQRLIAQRCGGQAQQIIAGDINYEINRRMRYASKTNDEQTKRLARQRGEEDGLLNAFCIEYRREYQLAYNEADRLWVKSGIKHFTEFLVIECGIFAKHKEKLTRERVSEVKPKLGWSNGE